MAQFKIVDDINYPHFVGLVPSAKVATDFVSHLASLNIDAATKFHGANVAIYVANKKDVSKAKVLLLAFCNKSFDTSEKRVSKSANGLSTYFQTYLVRFNLVSVVTLIEILCIVFYILSLIDSTTIYSLMCVMQAQNITDHHEYYRLFTPIFIHFSLMHIAFNLVIFEAFARPMENVLGPLRLIFLIVVSAFISNILQYLVSAQSQLYILFGGMSGVVYAIIGYMAMLNLRSDIPSKLYLPKGLLTVSVIFIAFGFFFDGIANLCHVSGLLVGLLQGYFDKRTLKFK